MSVLFQIGLTVSRFKMSDAMTALDDFRPGYFRLDVAEIGTYSGAAEDASSTDGLPAVTAKPPAPRSLVFRILSALFPLQSRRDAAAAKLLKARGLTALQRAKYWAARKRNSGKSRLSIAFSGAAHLLKVSIKSALLLSLKLTLFPLVKSINWMLKKLKGDKKKNMPKLE